MSDRATDFTGSIPQFYDHGLGPVFFTDFADDIARRAAPLAPMRVLEIAAGTGIVTRRLRDLLPRAHLIATDLNPPMLEVARQKFRPGEAVEFQPADATALPFPDASFDAVVCQFGVMFFPDKDKGHREARRVLVSGGRYLFSVWDSHRHNPIGWLITDILARFFPQDPPQFYQVPFSYHRIEPAPPSSGPLRAAWSWLKQTTVCHERTDERRCDAVQEMRVGPSEPAVRSRLQTTASCDGQEPWW